MVLQKITQSVNTSSNGMTVAVSYFRGWFLSSVIFKHSIPKVQGSKFFSQKKFTWITCGKYFGNTFKFWGTFCPQICMPETHMVLWLIMFL